MSAFGLSGSQMTPASDAASTVRCKRAAFEYQIADIGRERRHGEQRYGQEQRQDRDIASFATSEEQDSVLLWRSSMSATHDHTTSGSSRITALSVIVNWAKGKSFVRETCT